MSKKWGIALIVRARSSGRILGIQELEAKPEIFKKAGMYSIPLETGEKGETLVEAALRTSLEEVGLPEGRIGEISVRPEPIIGFRHGIPIYLAWTEVDREYVGRPKCAKVKYAGWFTVAEMLALAPRSVRIEVARLLDVYAAECLPLAVAAE